MFDCPIPIPRDTHYHELDIGPEATPDEIRNAQTRARERLQSELREVEKSLDAIESKVPGLKEAAAEARAALGGSSEDEAGSSKAAKAKAHEAAQTRLTSLEAKARLLDPRFDQLRRRMQEIGDEVNEINRTALESPEARLKYDAAHPPLEVLKIADCTQEELLDPRVALGVIRRELTEFLTDQGEPVYCPSDLVRRDFTSDFTPTALLDDGNTP